MDSDALITENGEHANSVCISHSHSHWHVFLLLFFLNLFFFLILTVILFSPFRVYDEQV